MNQYAIYICIFWYSKICWFQVKKNADASRTKGLCQVIHIFLWIFFGSIITVPSFIIVSIAGHVRQILREQGGGTLFAPHPFLPSVISLKRPILNRINTFIRTSNNIVCNLKVTKLIRTFNLCIQSKAYLITKRISQDETVYH